MSDHGGTSPNVIQAIYAAASSPDLWPAALDLVARDTGATGSMLAVHGPDAQTSALLLSKPRDDYDQRYLTLYLDNPYTEALRRVPPERPVIGATLVAPERLRRTAFHADILAPQNIEEVVFFAHAALSQGGASGGLCLVLDPDQAERREAVADRLARLTPHLARAIDLSLHRDQTSRIGNALLEAMDQATLLLDHRGHIVAANRAADNLLAEADGLLIERNGGRRLALAHAGEARRLAAALAGALSAFDDDASGDWPVPRVTRPSGRPPLLIFVTPLPPAEFPIADLQNGAARLLVIIVDPGRSVDARVASLSEAFGLTAAETRVSGLIGSGRSLPEIASLLGVSTHTVKSHLVRCFDKTGMRSQVELVRLIEALPPRRH